MINYVEQSLKTLKELVSYYTVAGEPKENAPFGETNLACLLKVLEIGKKLGFDVKNVDGYAGHIEWKGKNDEILGILGHVDVVPVGEGWTHDPLACEVDGDFMYGRGVIDDKGPVVSCLYAMKELKDSGYIPNKTIRLIIGCNEENGSTCVEHYFTKEQMPTVGFSPDGDFPVIHCEKGIIWLGVDVKNDFKYFKNIIGGEKTNMVPAKATALYTGDKSEQYFLGKGFGANTTKEGIIVTAYGRNGHGSTPWVGDNAIWKLLKVISEIEESESAVYLYNTFCQDLKGIASKIQAEDLKSGELSQNLGTIKEEDGMIKISVDIRFPISTSKDKIMDTIAKNAPTSAKVYCINYQKYLFVDPDGELVTTLMGIYKKHTGSNTKSLIIGGGTYAREISNGVAFGPLFEGELETMHMPNERLSLTNYKKFFEIYKETILELSK